MEKKMLFRVFAALLGFVVMGTAVLAAEAMAQGWGKIYSSDQFIGMKVNNLQGEELGRVQDIAVDSRGYVPFVIVFNGGMWSLGGKLVAIPYGALSFEPTGKGLVLDMTKEKFLSAPDYRMRNLASEKWAEDVYRYFGQQPYWTEGESFVGEHPRTQIEEYE